MITFLLILHGLASVVLLGGLTHQALAAIWPARAGNGVVRSFRAVNAAVYTKANIVLYLATFVLGGLIYPAYRVAVRTWIERARLWPISGSFELKEQFVAIGLGMLPLYWWIWRQPLDTGLSSARAWVTGILCAVVWFSFLVGHVLNNVRGLFGQ
ncbi:MAG: hypothetical protein AB7F96_08630 [Beijerinckiaceae bacterium]